MNNPQDITEIKKRIELLEKRAFYSERLNEVLSVAPTYTPKTFREQFAFYVNGATIRLYVYVNGAWRYTALS